MKLSKEFMMLYAVTDGSWLGNKTLAEVVDEALKGGITFLQLREKELSQDAFLKEAKEIKRLAKEYEVPFIINDDIDVMLKSDADGVHIGQDDGNAAEVRCRIGESKILGVSVQNVEQAVQAEKDGADYLGVGAMFPTDTKADAVVVSMETLKDISEAVMLPIVVIGGINKNTIPQFKNSGAHGAAVVSGIFAEDNPCQAAKELLECCKEVFL